MEEFAQSRGDDDLFDDEIKPISSSEAAQHVTAQLEQTSISASELSKVQLEPPQPHDQHPTRGRGRGGSSFQRGSRQPQGRGLADSKFAPKPPPPLPIAAAPTDGTTVDISTQPPLPESAAQPTEPKKTPAVRGDRTATGGFSKPSLTPAELDARINSAKQRSLALSAAHAKAEADKDDFESREKIASKKRQDEDKRIRALEGEREKNRQRKMKGMGTREWEVGKEEKEFGGRDRPRFKYQEGDDLRMYEWKEDRGRGRGTGRGRGDFGGGRERPRGGRGGPAGGEQRTPALAKKEDFPSLPGAPRQEKEKPLAPVRQDSDLKPMISSTNWAEQVESEAP